MLSPSSDSSGFVLSPIKAMELAASRIPGVVSLAQGIPSFATPQVIKDFVHERIDQGLCDKYSLTIGLGELREEIALSLQRDGLNYDPETEIIVTAGSIEGITAAILACTSPGDEVLLPSPTYASYRGSLAIAGCVPRYIELDEDSNFDFHIERVREAISRKTTALLYCSPNNPTGTLYSEQKTRAIMELASKHNLTVIIDEVYKDFYYSADKHFTPASLPEARERVVRVCSFSKAFAMTGWRVGFVHGSSQLMRRILKFHDAMVTCAPVVSQYAAIAALRFGEPFLQEFRNEFKKRRDYTIGMLDQISMALDYQMPKATYFVFPRIKDSVRLARDSQALANDILEKAKVAVVPGIAFGPSGESHIRIMYGRDWPDLQTGMERIGEYFLGARAERQSLLKTDSTSPSVESTRSLKRSGIALLLRYAARSYLLRTRPLVVGVVGTRGKTVYKRTIAEVLKLHFKTRSSILSYNTEIGLPLAILGLPSPTKWKARLAFPFKLLSRVLANGPRDEVLIVEYGVASSGDAETLLNIVKPDWLVVADVSSPDPNVPASIAEREISKLISALPKERVLWSAEDTTITELGLDLDKDLSFRMSDIVGTSLNSGRSVYGIHKEYVGRSACLGVLAAVKLAEKLGVPQKTLVSNL